MSAKIYPINDVSQENYLQDSRANNPKDVPTSRIPPLTEKESVKYSLSSYRYIVVIAYFFVKFTAGATYGLYIPFSDYLQGIYQVNHIYIVITAFAFQGLSPFVNLLYANKIILSMGTQFSVHISF